MTTPVVYESLLEIAERLDRLTSLVARLDARLDRMEDQVRRLDRLANGQGPAIHRPGVLLRRVDAFDVETPSSEARRPGDR